MVKSVRWPTSETKKADDASIVPPTSPVTLTSSSFMVPNAFPFQLTVNPGPNDSVASTISE